MTRTIYALARALLLLAVAYLLAGAQAHAAATEVDTIDAGGVAFQRYTLSPTVSYVISKTPAPAALVLVIQGSGCEPALFEFAPGQYGSTVLGLTTAAKDARFAVMIVEKPYEAKKTTGARGTMKGCPQAFIDNYSFETWFAANKAAYEHAVTLPWVRKDRHLVFGISEGADIAAALAAAEPSLTHVALHGATGTTQLFDFIAGAYARGDTDEKRLAEIKELEAEVADINAHPDSTNRWAWGHTYKRWSSFFHQSALSNLERSHARVYLVSGMADQSVPILSTEILSANLLAQNRDVTFRRLPNASHELYPKLEKWDNKVAIDAVEAEYATIRDWYLSQ